MRALVYSAMFQILRMRAQQLAFHRMKVQNGKLINEISLGERKMYCTCKECERDKMMRTRTVVAKSF